jgi:hypothetical protein
MKEALTAADTEGTKGAQRKISLCAVSDFSRQGAA